MRIRAAIIVVIAVAVVTACVWIELRHRSEPIAPSAPRIDASALAPAVPPESAVATRSEVPSVPTKVPAEGPAIRVSTAAADRPREKDVQGRRFGRVVAASDRSPVRDAVIGVPASLDFGREDRETSFALDKVSEVARADGDGRFDVGAATIDRVLVVTATGLGSVVIDRAWLGESRDTALEIPMAPAARLLGKVLDRVGVPKPKCEIRILANAFDAMPPSGQDVDYILMMMVGARCFTDDQGAATFSTLPAGVPFDIEIWAGDERLVRDPSPTVLDAGRTASKEWRLGSGCTVHGRVVDQFERPVAKQTIWITQRGLNLRPSAKRAIFYSGDEDKIAKSVVTDGAGCFTIDDVGPGIWWLGAAASYHFSTSASGDETDSASGDDNESESGDEGESESGDDAEVAPVAESLNLANDRPSIDVLLHVHRGLFIRGKMLDPDGKPAGGHMTARPQIDGLVGFIDFVCNNADGEFKIGPLEPGEYEITGSAWNSSPSDTNFAPCLPILVAAGRDDVVLQLRRGGTIRPKAVRRDTGTEVAAAFCLVSSTKPKTMWGCGEFSEQTSSDFAGLAPDTYDLAALTSDGCAGCLRGIVVGAGAIVDGVRVPVEPGAHVSCRFVGTESEWGQVQLWVDSTYFGGDGIHRGTTRTFVVPHGRVTVRWSAASEHFEEVVELSVGETRELTWPRPK